MNKIFTIPNLLSMLRLVLIPVFCWTYIGLDSVLITILLMVFSGITDLADGYIARKFNMTSDFGKFLDPLADKLTLVAFLFCLTTRFPHLLILFGLMLIKELTLSLAVLMIIKKTGYVPMALWHGKLVTALQYLVLGLHLIFPQMPLTLSYLQMGLVIGLMTLSFILYLTSYVKMLKQK